MGDGTTIDSTALVTVGGVTGAIAIGAGQDHSLAVEGSGSVLAWGFNSLGQIGDGTTTDRSSAILVDGLTEANAVAGGQWHSLALATVPPDTIPPTIALLGDNPFDVEIGDAYVEPGATVTDDVDTGLTAVIDASAVDTNTLGSYSVTYDATDNSGNDAVQVIRTVNVVDTTAPAFDIFPTDVTLEATSQNGAVHVYAVTANDNVNPDPLVVCEPESNSTFPLGATTVDCRANDGMSNGGVAWWPAENNTDDYFDSNDAVWNGNASFASGVFGQAFDLDGSSRVEAANFSQVGPFSVDMWVKAINPNQLEFTGVFSLATGSGTPGAFQIELDGSGNYRLDYKEGTGSGSDKFVDIGPATTEFQHLVVTFNGSTVQTYLNGQPVGSGSWTDPVAGTFTRAKIGVNRDNTSNRHFQGQIDEVKIHNRALTGDEILATAASAGNEASASFNVTVVDTTAPVFDPALVDIEEETTDPAGLNVVYTAIATDAVNLDPFVSCDPVSGSLFQPGGATTVTCTAYDGLGSEVTDYDGLADGIVSYWAADNNGNDSVDGNLGTLEGDTNFVTGVNGLAFSFDGTGDYVQIGDKPNLTFTDSMTMAAWIYPTGPGNGPGGGIVVNKEGQYEFARFGDGTIRWAFANTSPGWTWIDTSYVAPENQWTHIAIVYDGDTDTVITYANGAEVHSLSVVGSIGSLLGYPQHDFRIGGRISTPHDFIGRIDDVKIFGRALQADEIPATTLSPGNVGESTFTVTVTLIGLTVDIKPGSVTNPLNLNGRGVLPVAILGGGIELNDIDIDSLRLSAVDQIDPNEPDNPQVPVAHLGGHGLEDVNGDGIDDLMLHFRYAELEIPFDWIGPAFVDLIVTGLLTSGTEVEGTDFVSLRPVSANIVNNLNGLGLGPNKETKPGNGPKEGKGPENGNGKGGGHWFFGDIDDDGGNADGAGNGNGNNSGNGNNGNDDPGGNGNNGNDDPGGNGNNGNDDPRGKGNNGNDDPGGNGNNGNGGGNGKGKAKGKK